MAVHYQVTETNTKGNKGRDTHALRIFGENSGEPAGNPNGNKED